MTWSDAKAMLPGGRLLACAIATSLIALWTTDLSAYEVVHRGGPEEYLKWGTSKHAGTPGGVVTWGFLAEGTPGSAYCRIYCPGKSSAVLPNFYADPQNSNVTTPITLVTVRDVVQAAFDAWSAVADVQFDYVGVDSSLKSINDPAATSPMIRIGAYAFDGLVAYFSAGTGFAPPPNGGTGAGDIFFNTNVGYQLASNAADSTPQQFPTGGGLYMTDLYYLALHEIGHAIGLGASSDTRALMWGGQLSAALQPARGRSVLSDDDIAGARFLYGAARHLPGHD